MEERIWEKRKREKKEKKELKEKKEKAINSLEKAIDYWRFLLSRDLEDYEIEILKNVWTRPFGWFTQEGIGEEVRPSPLDVEKGIFRVVELEKMPFDRNGHHATGRVIFYRSGIAWEEEYK